MTRPKRRVSAEGEKAKEERIQDATELFLRLRDSQKRISIRQAAMTHGIPWTTLRDRVRGGVQQKSQQKLTLFEEVVIESYCNTLYVWGWPPRVHQIRRM